VILDEHMEPIGKLLGTDASRILREKDQKIMIVGFTGNCAEENVERSKESGQDLFWSKPAPPNEAALEDLTTAFAERRMKWSSGRTEERGKGKGKGKGKQSEGRREETEKETEKDKDTGKEKEKEEEIGLPGQVVEEQ